MPAHSVSRLAQQLEMRRPRTRSSGALRVEDRPAEDHRVGPRRRAAMKSGISSAGCWPSASIVSTWVKPAAVAASRGRAARRRPCPGCGAARSTRSPGRPCGPVPRAPAAVPSVLPSTTTHTAANNAAPPPRCHRRGGRCCSWGSTPLGRLVGGAGSWSLIGIPARGAPPRGRVESSGRTRVRRGNGPPVPA